MVQSGVVYHSNPTESQIYPSSHNGNTDIYPPSISSYPSQNVYGQYPPQYAPITSYGQRNPDIDPPNYDEATVNNVRKPNVWKL